MSFKLSYDLGATKPDIAAASATAGTAGIEILVDTTKILTPDALYNALRLCADRVSELNYPPA